MEPLSLVCFGVWLLFCAVSLQMKSKNNNKKAIPGDGDVKKNKKNGHGGCGCGGGERKTKKDAIDKPKGKLEQKKSNELVQPQLATAMLKVPFGCSCYGCPKKIQEVVTKTIGYRYHQMAIDQANGQVTVKGSMTDMKALAKQLELQLKKHVDIVPLSPQKEGEKKEKSGYDHKKKDGGFKEEKNKKKEGEKKNKDEQNKSKKNNKDDGRNKDDKKKIVGAGEENRNKKAKDNPKENPEDKNSKPKTTLLKVKKQRREQRKSGDSGGDGEKKRKSGGEKKEEGSDVEWCTFVEFITVIFLKVSELLN